MNNKRIILLSIGLVILIMSIGVGYGYLKTTLSINGSVTLASTNKFTLKKVDIENPESFWQDEYKLKIENIIFQKSDNIVVPEDAIISWDIGLREKKDLISYIKNSEIEDKYDLYIVSKGSKIYANEDSSYLFDGFISLKSIEGLELLDTSKVTNASHMFSNLSELTELDLSNQSFDILENANNMFSNNPKMTKIIMGSSSNNTITNTSYMFQNNISLIDIDITNIETDKVTDMSHMFENLTSIVNLPMDNLKTSNVTNFSYMFSNCSSVTSINLDGIDTIKSEDMSYMFNGLSKITEIDASAFIGTNLKDINHMFNNCALLQTINLSNLNSNGDVNWSYLFANNPSLTNINIENYDPSKIDEFEEIVSNIYTTENILEIKVKNESSKNMLKSYINVENVNIVYDEEEL